MKFWAGSKRSISLSEAGIPGLSGSLRLVCASSPERGTYLAQQSFTAPMHISKSYWDGDALLVHLVNPTAGVFGGDCIRTHVAVEAGARVLLSSPSATRFHPSRGRDAQLDQVFEIRAGGSLDIYPEISIPQRDSRSRQRTTINVELGGELIYLETMTPGRVASGECFVFDEYAWATDLTVGGRLILRERAAIRPGDESTAGLRALFPASYHASVVFVSPRVGSFDDYFERDVSGLSSNARAVLAASQLRGHGWIIRLLASDGVAFQDGIRKARALIYDRLGRKQPDARRNAL
jgi:urease accessory protein